MNFAAILGLLMPLISGFLRKKSGKDLSGLLSNNQGAIGDMLQQVLGGASGGSIGGANIAALAPLLTQKSPTPVIILPEGMTAITEREMSAFTANPDGGVITPAELTPIDTDLLKEITERLESLEQKLDLTVEITNKTEVES